MAPPPRGNDLLPTGAALVCRRRLPWWPSNCLGRRQRLNPRRAGRIVAPPFVVAGSASGPFAERLARELGTILAHNETKRFPDGEAYVRLLEPAKGRDAIVVQATAPDSNLVEL